jgi:hypothetical protein
MRRRTLAAVLPLLIAASAADAQTPNPGLTANLYCIPGLTAGCFAVDYSLAPYQDNSLPGFAQVLSIRIQNLQGSIPDLPVIFGLKSFGIRLNTVNAAIPAQWQMAGTPLMNSRQDIFTPIGAVDTHPFAHTMWTFTQGQGQGNRDFMAFYQFGGGIVGCDHSDDPVAGYAHSTCLPKGLNGWLQLDVLLTFIGGTGPTPVIDHDDIDLSFAGNTAGCSIPGHNNQGFTNLQYQLCATVSPEPATLALILPGLVGLGGFGVVRRRSRRVAA